MTGYVKLIVHFDYVGKSAYQGWETRGHNPAAYLDDIPPHGNSQRIGYVFWTVPQVHRKSVDAGKDNIRTEHKHEDEKDLLRQIRLQTKNVRKREAQYSDIAQDARN